MSRRTLQCSLLRTRRFQRPWLVQFFGESIQWVDTAWCLGMTLVSRSAVKCLVGRGSKAIHRGMLNLMWRKNYLSKCRNYFSGNVFSYATVTISHITLLFAMLFCIPFFYSFLVPFPSFSILLYTVLCFFLFSFLLYSSFSHLKINSSKFDKPSQNFPNVIQHLSPVFQWAHPLWCWVGKQLRGVCYLDQPSTEPGSAADMRLGDSRL